LVRRAASVGAVQDHHRNVDRLRRARLVRRRDELKSWRLRARHDRQPLKRPDSKVRGDLQVLATAADMRFVKATLLAAVLIVRDPIAMKLGAMILVASGVGLSAVSHSLELRGNIAPFAESGVSVERAQYHIAAFVVLLGAMACYVTALVDIFRKPRAQRRL